MMLSTDFPSICSPPWSYEDSTKEAVTLKWKVPKDDGGSEIINYTLQMRETNKKVNDSCSSSMNLFIH